MMFQGFLKNVSREFFQGSISNEFKECFKEILGVNLKFKGWVVQGSFSFKGVSRMFQESFKDVQED